MKYDVLIKGGRVVDPARGTEGVADVAVVDGRIMPAESNSAERIVDATGCLVFPGLIDFHCHVFYKGSLDGVPADAALLPQGVTTAVDGGNSGSRQLRAVL